MAKAIKLVGGIPTEVEVAIGGSGDWQQIFHTVTLGELTAKLFVMDPIALVPSEVSVDIVGGSSLKFGVDFTVATSVFSWTGLGLEPILEEGDILKLCYFA